MGSAEDRAGQSGEERATWSSCSMLSGARQFRVNLSVAWRGVARRGAHRDGGIKCDPLAVQAFFMLCVGSA